MMCVGHYEIKPSTYEKFLEKNKHIEREKERKTLVSRGDRRELSVCSIHPQSDAHRTKVWKYISTPPFREQTL
jgi:hypothetical protein